MSSHLCLSLTFLDASPSFHGRADAGEPEWPPSPLRLFQALVAAAASRAGGRPDERSQRALAWLECQPAPQIIAPARSVGVPVRIAVPNNYLDIPMAAWAKGQEPPRQPNELKSMKTVRPTHLRGRDAIHHLYALRGDDGGHVETLCETARCISHLGWGVDLVAGHGRVLGDGAANDLQREDGHETWQPSDDSAATGLRVPQPGTLAALTVRHGAFLNRLANDGFSPVHPLTAFRVVGYRRATDPPVRSFAAFEIWKPLRDLAQLKSADSKFRPFDAPRRTRDVAAWVRHAAATAAQFAGWDQDRIASFIHGHAPGGDGPATGTHADQRLAFLPLPSITPLRVESIRRVLVTAPPGDASAIAWVRQALSGRELFPEQQPLAVAMLSMIPDGDRNLSRYTGTSQVWSTVTPVILPGRYTHGDARARRLFRSAFAQAGLPSELLDQANIEYRDVGFLPGVDLARRYLAPAQYDRLPRYHVRVCWPVPVRGPVAIGAGRYRGLGLFATEDHRG